MNKTNCKKKSNSNSGFIIADFLFAFVLVIGVGIFIFALTFSLATIEITQYIVWSTARNFAAANTDVAKAEEQAKTKFENLRSTFPLLSGQGSTSGGSSWFVMETAIIGDLAKSDADFAGKTTGGDRENLDGQGEQRQPWTGASSKLTLKLFSGLQIPFLGKIAEDTSDFSFPIRAFIIRNPSVEECQKFYKAPQRFTEGIIKLEEFSSIGSSETAYFPQEDNGC